jgi:hypothetical protein
MTVTYTAFSENSLLNIYKPPTANSFDPNTLVVTRSSSSQVVFQANFQGLTLRAELNGTFGGIAALGSTAAQLINSGISSLISSENIFVNNVLFETIRYATPVIGYDSFNAQFDATSNLYSKIFAGDDVFIASAVLQGAASDQVAGYGGNDTFSGFGDDGSDLFDGGTGIDTAVYRGKLANYEISKASGFWNPSTGRNDLSGILVKDKTGLDGTDQLVNVERLQFSDITIALDLAPITPTPTTPTIPITPITPTTPTTPIPVTTPTFTTTNAISVPTGSLTSNSTAANDLITGNTATNVVDTVAYKGSIKDYKVAIGSNGNYTVIDAVSTRDGSDVVVNVERLKFSSDPATGANRIALDLNPTQASGKAALLIGAVLPGKLALDASKYQLMGTVIDLFDQGFSLQLLSGALLRLPIWDILTGKPNPTKADVATYLVNNVYGVGAGQTANLGADLARSLAIDAMNAETTATQGTYLATLAASTASQNHIDLVGIQATGLVYLG